VSSREWVVGASSKPGITADAVIEWLLEVDTGGCGNAGCMESINAPGPGR
jgi:hypothetical protein